MQVHLWRLLCCCMARACERMDMSVSYHVAECRTEHSTCCCAACTWVLMMCRSKLPPPDSLLRPPQPLPAARADHGLCCSPACRTDSKGGWYNSFKPVTDCTAQWSPAPGAAALAAAGLQVAAPLPGSAVDSALCGTLPASSRACNVQCP
jgi:hypothetical protein